MSEVLPVGATPVHTAIARAASRTGTDFNYLLAQAKLESALNPSARAGTSSAAGLYQFTQGTWLQTLDRHGADHGLEWAGKAIQGGRVADPAMRAQIMALRFDPQASALMAGELANDNRAALQGVLGREPDAAELYLAHFLGSGGANQFLSALQNDPSQSAAGLMPKPAAANRAIFYERSGAPRSVAQVMELIRGKVEGAMGHELPPAQNDEGLGSFNMAKRSFETSQTPAPQTMGASATPLPRPSMAETLRATFALGGNSQSAPAFVHAAYGQLKSLGL